jgi:FkbM family methyltransferase
MKLKKLFKKKSRKNSKPKQVQVGDFSLTAVGDHPVQDNLNGFKYYSRNLPRLAKYIEAKYPAFSIIDIGANIGDTVALLRSAKVNQPIYAVEGEPTYFTLLHKNVQQFKDVTIYESFLGENSGVATVATEVNDGTARLNQESKRDITIQRLDDLAIEKDFKDVKLLKIDTDGYDLKILRGGFNLIKAARPVIFFEYDAVYLEEQEENGTDIFEQLHDKGYNKIIYYDNYGKLLLSTTTDNKPLIKQLYGYMRKKEGAFPYYDVCAFHKGDDALADECISKEMAFFHS